MIEYNNCWLTEYYESLHAVLIHFSKTSPYLYFLFLFLFLTQTHHRTFWTQLTVQHECIRASANFILANAGAVCRFVCLPPRPLLPLSFTHLFALFLHLRQKARLLSSLTSLPLSSSPQASPTLSCSHYCWIKLGRRKLELGSRESKMGDRGTGGCGGRTVVMGDREGSKKRRETTNGNKKKSKEGREKEWFALVWLNERTKETDDRDRESIREHREWLRWCVSQS